MGRRKETWVQGRLFEMSEPTQMPEPNRKPVRRPGLRRLDRSRVTRDPAVARSYEEGRQQFYSVKMGLAQALARRTPEERAALRARLAGSLVA